MSGDDDRELSTWRLLDARAELDELLAAITTRVLAPIPIESLALRRVLGDGRLETLAAWRRDGAPVLSRHPLEPAEVRILRAAIERGASAWGADEIDEARTLLATSTDNATVVLGLPLEIPTALVAGIDGDPHGAIEALRAIARPLAIAAGHAARVAELERLRESGEARGNTQRVALHDMSESIVGSDSGLRSVMQRVEQVARTEAPVLVLGETGSGKEVVARAIHARSRRAAGPFLRVNCGAIPAELVDSELFGHERGSFTGAINTRRGWFERADGGTLLLDEVAELPPAAQVRLLRVLQDGGFERVGGQQRLTADVRIVAATHRDVPSMIASGEFREDLWYRISVFPIQLPPLRARGQDIESLARHFAANASTRLHGVALQPSVEDLALLRAYDWPGNVRELSAVIERATILGNGLRLDVATALGALPGSRLRDADAGSLQSVNRGAIERALASCEGRIEGNAGAARLLGVHPATLRSRMRKLGIDWSRFRRGVGRFGG